MSEHLGLAAFIVTLANSACWLHHLISLDHVAYEGDTSVEDPDGK